MCTAKLMLIAPASVIHTVKWANGLSASGYEVHLVTQHKPVERLNDEVALHILPFRGLKGYFLNAWSLRRLKERISPDVINAHYATGYGVLSMLARIQPYILSVWGSDVYIAPYNSKLHYWLVCKSLRSASRLASTSVAMANQVRELLNEPDKQIYSTPFGVDMAHFHSSREIFSSDKIVLGTVKALEDKYGIDVLIKAFAKLCSFTQLAEKDLKLVIAGDGSKKGELIKLSADLGVSQNVEFLGRVVNSRVVEVINNMDVFIISSRVESFGVAAVEASACERACIATDVGGLPEVILDQSTGILVKSDVPDELANAMLFLIQNPEQARQYGKAARKLVSAEYSESVVLDKMMDVLSENIQTEK